MEAVKELLFLLVVQCVRMADVGQRLLCFQSWKDDLIFSLHKEAFGSHLPEQVEGNNVPCCTDDNPDVLM